MAKYLDYTGLQYLWTKIKNYVSTQPLGANVRYDVQSLTDAQKEQARQNIAAANTNPNLLRNWYWVGGGTAGKFPVNQRGKNYYAVNDYTIDGWKGVNLYADGKTVKVATQDGGLVLAGDTGSQDSYVQFQQIIDNPPYGKEVTLSVLVDTLGADSEGNYPQIWCGASVYKNVTNVGLISTTFTYPTASSENYIRIVLYDGATTAASVRIQAIKLELGSVSTLEQDAAPDYGVELTRCIYSKADPNDPYANNGFGRSNPNLLDNAYFVGGGSQLGDNIFPINQRGQTSYTGGYGIDRWRCWQASTVTLTATGLTFATGASGDGLFQYFPKGKFESLYGETVTASLLLTDGTLYTATGVASADCWIATSFSNGYFGYICNGTEANFRVSLDANQSISIKAVKLEKGTVSTLANDPPPDFGEELRKCQHYLYAVTFPGYSYTGQICFALDTTNINWVITTPTPMVQDKLPSVTVTNSLYANGVAISNYAIVNYPYGNNVKVSAQAGGLTNGQLYPITTSANEAKVLISAEL